jgi:ribulose-5-phosphate 4-epimerase/fuculose-1-phosphate aldolase
MGLDKGLFRELIEEIQSQGYSTETAGHYAALIGDTPLVDEQGRFVVIDNDGKELARLQPLKFFGNTGS